MINNYNCRTFSPSVNYIGVQEIIKLVFNELKDGYLLSKLIEDIDTSQIDLIKKKGFTITLHNIVLDDLDDGHQSVAADEVQDDMGTGELSELCNCFEIKITYNNSLTNKCSVFEISKYIGTGGKGMFNVSFIFLNGPRIKFYQQSFTI